MTYNPANDNAPPRPASFDQLLAKYDRLIRKKCKHNEDLCQDVRLRAIERWQSYREDGNFVAWIDFIVRGLRQEKARKDKRRNLKEHLFKVSDVCIQLPSQAHHTDIGLALDSLTPTESISVQYSAMGYLCREIGEIHGIPKHAAERAARTGREWLAANDNKKSGKKNAAA